jgi:hypothetical protein
LRDKEKAKAAGLSICYQKDNMAIFVHGFSKNENSTLSPKELEAFKEFTKLLFAYSETEIQKAVDNKVLIEVRI